MIGRAELAKNEARMFAAFWADGVLDLVAGAGVVLIGTGWLLGFFLAGVVAPVISLSAWFVLRQRITHPRLGQVTFGPARRFELRYGLVAILSLGVLLLGFTLFGIAGWRPPVGLHWLAPAIPAAILGALSLSTAEVLRLWRFVLYALVFFAAGLGVSALDADPGWAMAVAGGFIACNGTRLLVAFLHAHPPLPTEMEG